MQVEQQARSINYLIILNLQAAHFQRLDATSALTGQNTKYEEYVHERERERELCFISP